MIAPNNKRNIMKALLLYVCFKKYCNDKQDLYISMCKSNHAKNRRQKERPSWEQVNKGISATHFRRMFRMSRECFNKLCGIIILNVGEDQFKSEAYINEVYRTNSQSDERAYNIYQAHLNSSGGYVSGEVKLALAIRMLAGGGPLDLSVIFDISPSHCQTIFIWVLVNWIIGPNIGKMDIVRYMNDEEAMKKVSQGFARRSNGVLRGAIGAIDGWLVKIQRPWVSRDNVKDPASFFSRKGFYALNVQCMVDDAKRVLWASFSHRGSSHDSTCFRETSFYNDILKSLQNKLFSMSFFILGDSAYAIESFILPPYDNAKSKSAEDAFNFYQSSARITVECAFGEINRRWGIFWSPIAYSLKNTAIICKGAMHLHNFLVDWRESLSDSHNEVFTENEIFDYDRLDNGITSSVICSDATRPSGRPTDNEVESRMNGLMLRDHLRQSLKNHNMERPSK